MANGKRDVNLVIRAKDEASRAFELASSAIESLLNLNNKVGASATGAGTKLEQMATAVLSVDKVISQFTGKADAAAAALQRQQVAITAYESRLVSLKAQQLSGAAAADKLRQAIVQTTLDGGDTGPLIAKLAAVGAEMRDLESESKKLDRTLANAQASYNPAALQEYERTLKLIGSASTFAKSEADQYTHSLEAQAAAATRNADVLRRVNAATGVTRDKGDYDLLAAQIRQTAEARDLEIQKLRAEEAATASLSRAKEEQTRINRQLRITDDPKGKQAGASAAVFQEADTAAVKRFEQTVADTTARTREMDAAAAKLRAELNPLAVIENRLAAEQLKLNALFKAGKVNATELAGGLKLLEADAKRAIAAMNGSNGLDSRGRPSMFGLKPYELQNLGYQVNDVVTQLASGTSLSQTLAQQGGQLLQLFPRVGSSIAAALASGPVLALVAGLATLAMAFKTAADEAEKLRKFEGILAANADGANYSAAALRKVTAELDHYGMSAEEALAITRVFLKEGFRGDVLVEFGQAAKDMADVLGIDVKDAASQLSAAFSGTYDDVLKLNQATNAFNADQLNHIKTLFEQGRATEATAEAFRIFSGRMEDGATKMRGPWTDAARGLGNAWDDMWKSIGNSGVVTGTLGALERLARGLTATINQIRGATTLADVTFQKQQMVDSNSGKFLKLVNPSKWQAEFNRLHAEENRLYAEQRGNVGAINKLKNDGTSASKAATDAVRQETEELKAKNKEASDAERLGASEVKARTDAEKALGEERFRNATDAAKQEFIAAKVAEARRQTEEKITQEHKQQAAEAKRTADAREKALVADINNNGRDKLISTAQQFNGFSENNESQRASLQDFFKKANLNVDPKMTAWCAAFVNAVLATNGLPGTGKLNAKSFLGFGSDAKSNPQVGDIVILNRGDNSAEGHVGFFQGFDENGNVKVLGGNQGNKVGTQSFKRDDVVGIRRAPSLGDVAQDQQREAERLEKQHLRDLAAREEKQENFNGKVDDENEKRRLGISSLQAQNGLIGEALLAEQKKQAVAEALLAKQQEIEKINEDLRDKGLEEIKFTDAQKKAVEETTAAYFDLAHAKDAAAAKREAIETPVNELSSQRDALMERVRFFQERGNFGAAEETQRQLDTINVALEEAINKALAFWTAIQGDPAQLAQLGLTAQQIDTIKLKLEATRPVAENLGRQFLMTAQQINQDFAQGAASAFDRFAQSVAEGKNVMSSLKDAFLQFASDFLRKIAQMIIQQAIFNAIGGATGTGSGGLGGGLAGIISGLFHDGGVVGQGGGLRAADPAWFRNAMRYHSGGIAGLRPNEVPAILERGEEVLTARDPRHSANGGGAGGGSGSISVVNVFDPAEVLGMALGTKAGERSFINFVQQNSGAFKAALG